MLLFWSVLRMSRPRPDCRKTVLLPLLLAAAILSAGLPLAAKTVVDFNPNLDFSKYKTFAFTGGVENLLMFEVNPGLVNERVHRAVSRELTKKGLQEVEPGQNPDLVVRFWGNPSRQVNVTTMGNWGAYGPHIDSYWEHAYNEVSAASAKEGALLIDLLNPRSKDLVWRLYLIHKITTPDKEWKKADDEISKAFESYPPSGKELEEKKREREAYSGKGG
jgi:uncharacterized protein DUF4136